jgi:hypothetical protein
MFLVPVKAPFNLPPTWSFGGHLYDPPPVQITAPQTSVGPNPKVRKTMDIFPFFPLHEPFFSIIGPTKQGV